MNENIKWVYDELKKIDKDYDLGDYEEFDSIMNADGESRKWVYEQLQNNGYDIGDTYEEFESYIVPKSLSSLWEGDAPGAINNNVANISPKALQQANPSQPTATAQATQPAPQPQVVEQAKATNQAQASGQVTETPTAPSAPKAEETTPTATTSATSMVEAATPVAEQPKSVATETPTQETEQTTTPLSVQRDMAEQKGEEVVTGVQEETELPADEYWATHAKELGQLVPQAPQGYVVDNMPQFVTVGMLNNFYVNQYDAKVSGVIYNAIKRNMTKDGVSPTEEDVKAKIATMSEDAIANALNNEDKNAIYALKDEFKRADSNKNNASAMISKVIDATSEKDRKKEGEILEIPDNMLDVQLSDVVNGTDKDLEEYIASEDYNKVYRKAIADWANVKELFGEEAYNNTINGTGLDQYVHLGSMWRKMFGVADGANYPKQYEALVTSKMRDVYSAEDKEGALDNLYNAIGTIDSYIDIKNKLSQEELDAVLAQVNATIPWGSKLASWDDVFFYNHSKDAEVPYAMTAQARALMALNDYTDNVTMARANDGAIKTLEEQIQKRAEENRAKAQERVNANPLKYSNEMLLTPNSFASDFGMDTEYDYLNSALEIRKEAKEYKDNASVDEGFVANLWRGLTDKALDLGTWDFGLGEFKEAGMLMAITNKSDKGEVLTAGEEAFLDAIATRLATFATTKATKGYSTGASTAESLAFILEFAITPIKGGGALANKFARMMIAKYGKTMARKQAIKYSIGKGLAYVGGDLVKAGGMTATTGAPSVVADAMKRKIGNVSYTQMNDGSIVALRNNDGSIKTTTTKKIDGVETTTEGGESWGTAIKNAFLSRTATNMSEAIGAYLPGKAFAKTVGNKLGLAKLVKAYDKMSATDWAKAADRFFKKTQWNGFGQEYVEELVDGTLQALITQDTSVSDVFEAENLIDTALAVGVMSVLMSGAKTMGYRTASHQLKQDINNTTITGQDLFGKIEWAQIQSAIDGSTADNMSANVQSLINNNELSAPQKKTILRYAIQVAERDALLTNEDKQALAYEGETNIDNTARLQASAYQGYHTTDTQDQFIVNQQYIEKGKAVANMLGGEDADKSLQQRYKANGSYELADKVSHDTSLDVKQKQTILDYLGAKEKVASMGVRAQNDINNATINVGREVERKSNIQTGDILTVTHKYDGKQYYVIDGNVVTNQDGSINLDETTDDIIVEDAESGERMMMSPKMFAEAQLKPSGIKDAMREELNRRTEAYNNTIKYGHTLAVGSNITLRNAEGVDENKTIASVDNNAGVVTFVDGTTTTLNAIAEDARLRYSNQYPPSVVKPVVATKEEAQAENVGEPVVAEVATIESVEEEPTAELEEDVATPSPTQTPTEYNQEEQVVFIDDNGTQIEGEIVSEVDADGKVLIEGADGGIHQVATSQIVERIGTTPVAEAQGDNNAEPTTNATSEASSQEILDNSNEVETTTLTAETPTQSAPLAEIPTDEKGKKQYEQASVEDTINDIYNDPELDEEDADAYVQARIDGASKRIAQLEKKKPKMGEDIPGFKAERAKWREQLEAQQASLAYWQGVQEAVPEVRRRERARQQMEADLAEQERARQARAEQALRAEERGRNRGDYRKAMAQWNDTPGSFYEYVAQELLAGDYKMRWDDNGSTRGLGSHTTGRRNRNRKGEVKTSRGAEYNALRWLIDNNGISPEALADRLWNDYSGSYGEDMSGANPLDVLLDVITSMPTSQMMWDYVKGEHDARMEAEQGIEEQFTEAEIEAMERDAMYREKYGVSEEEYWSQEAQWDEFIESRDMSAEELGNYDNFVAEQRIKEEYERRNQENAEDEQRSNNRESERGTDVLSGTQSDNTRGNGDVAGKSEGIDGSSVEQDGVAQEEARLSEEDRQAIENMPIPMLKQQIKETTTTLINISQLSSEWQEKNRDNIERAKLILAYAKEELARKEGLKKSNKWGIKIGNSATPFSVVRKMFEEFNSNEDIAQLFDKVAKVFESLPIKIVFSDTIGSKGTQGWFSPTTATLKLPGHFVYGGRSLEQSKAETILHEMIHAVTTYALYINEKPHLQTDLGFRLSDDMHAAIRQLKRIYASIASDKDFKGEYGATSVHEMVAELSNVQFRDKLKKKNLWETIVDAIKQLFGIKPSNALEGAEAALEYMLNNFDRRQWDKMANMRGKRNKQLMIGNTTGLVDTPASRSLEVEERTMLNRLAKALGVEIEVVPTMAEANAKIVGNKITLALDAEQGAKMALGHELLHRIKALSPEAYEEFAQVIEAINPRTFEQAMIDVRLMYSRAGRTKSREALREEVVADRAGELMYNVDLMERFVDALETKSFKEQILNVIKSVFDAIKGIFKGADARAIAKAERVLYNAMKRANMVVNQGNTTEADSANEKLSIIGERGASALDKAEEATHRMENLDMARKMERYGYPTKSIRMATGWERGADGKWRYEIEDIKLKKEWEPYLWGEGVKLSEIVVGGELFKAYPELKNLTIRYDVNTQSLAYLDWEEQLIGVNPYNLHDSYPSVVHEIQHAIQEIEGFAKGGNSTMLNDRLSAQLNSLTATINKLRAEGKNKEVDAIQKRYRGLAEAVINNSEDDYGNYRKLGGEVESRNAEHRIGMTPEQRRATLLAETEDVAREDQIFLVENSGVSAMAENEMNDLISQMKANASVEPIVEISEENWVDKIETPIGDVKMGEHQKSKLFNKGREKQYGMLLETLSNPDIILEEQSKEDPTHERDSAYLFIKTFQKEDGSKYVHFESVTVRQDGLEVSISSHIIRENQLRNKMKSDRLLYKATALDQSTNLSAEQSIKGGSLSSTDKGSDNIGDVQEDAKYSLRSNTPFYSNAEYAVENIKQEKATPEQWLAMIQKNGGLKTGEDKWLGLSDWLKASDAKTLTKEEVLEFINQNKIAIEEVGYRGTVTENYLKPFEYIAKTRGEDFANMFKYAFYIDDFNAFANDDEVALKLYNIDNGTNLKDEYGYIADKDREIITEWAFQIMKEARAHTKIEFNNPIHDIRIRYTIKGLDNKREIALVVPTIESYDAGDIVHFGDAGDGRAVAWIRFGETTDGDDNRVLVIDEIQSHRHQDGREKGYRDALDDAQQSQNRVPDAPFDKNWHELAMKRMLRYAAENGFDKVAWTTGEQQAKRYGMSVFVDKISVKENTIEEFADGTPVAKNITITTETGRIPVSVDANGKIYGGEYDGKNISEVVGKELAEKIMQPGDFELSGGDLRLGGEGMKGFYDKMLPSFMNKYGKKWGVKVGEVTMPELQEGYQTMHSIDVTDAMKESVMEGQPLFRDGSGALSDADLSYANDPFAKTLGKSQRSKVKQAKFAEREREAMRNRVAELVEKLGIGERVELIEGGEFDNERKARAKGWYDARSGKIVINLANHTSVADIERTLLHEAVSHHGLRELFGKQFDTFLDNVFRSANYNIRTQIVDLATRNGWDFRTATEEYLAQLAEDTNFDALENNWSFWSKIKQLFMDMLESIGWNYQGPTLTDNELRYLLWRSYENMVNPGRHRSILGMAEDVVKREKFGIGTYSADENIESQVAEDEYVKYSLRDNVNDDVWEVNERFNAELQQQVDGTLPKGHIYQLGMPSDVLLATGIAKAPIQLNSQRLMEKSSNFGHDYELSELKDLVKAINNPIAIFAYGDKNKAQNIVVEIQHEGKNFIIGLSIRPTVGGQVLDINSIRNVFPKDNAEWLNWIAQGKALYIDKERVQDLINQQRTNLADVEYLDLNSIANVINEFVNPNIDDVKFSLRSKGVLHPDLTDTDGTRAKYNERMGSSGFKWREGYQDSMLSLKVLQEIIAEKHGLKEIPSWQNAYVEENEMSSRNKAMSDMYQRDFFKPLMAEVKRLIDKEGLKYEDIVTYLMAKHGLERNAVKSIEAAEQLADESMPKSADGKIDRDSNAWKSAFNEAYQETSKRDFSGLRGLFKTADAKIATGNAQMVVERMEQAVDTNALWNAIRSATNETLDIQRKGGLISKATYETLRDKYQFYIPLRGFNEKTAKDEYEYLTSSTPLLPPTMKRAKGRASMADDPLAHIGMLADSAIIQANRNKMKQAFYHFVVNNPSSVASVSEQWYVRNETTGRWESRNPIIPNGASADEMAEILSQFEAEMKELASNKKARRKRGDIKTDFITLPYQASEHEVRVKINGRDYTIYINGNPRAAQALNGLTNPEQFNDIITKGGKVINNFMAQMFTSKNPAFIVTNMARDLQWATNAVMVKEGFAYQKEYFKSLAEATKVLTMIAKHNKGILDMDDKTQRYFEEFLRYGGETGHTAINQIEEYKKNVERLVKDAKGMTTLPAKSWHALVDGIEYLNRSAEDFTRFAVYMASREMGRTPERSAHDAKEITVNFNKKGSGVMGARYFSAAYIFLNASLQSLNNMARMFKHHPINMSVAMSVPALVGFALPAILKAWMGDDDDEMYNNLPDWVRRNNIVLPFFGNTFLTIPLPHEMRPFYTMGTVAYDVIFNGYDAIEGLRDVALGFADMLPIDFAGNGGNIFVNMTPTFVQPVAQIMANVDYFGKPIYKKTEFHENDPEHSIAFKGTSPILIEASRLINAIGGGDDYRLGAVEKELGSMKMLNNPDVWEHLIDSYFGGVGKTAMRTIKTAQIIYGEALELFGKENKFAELNEVRNYPVLSSFIAGGEERTGAQYKITEQYYELLDKAKDYKEDLGDYKRAAIHDMKYAEELVEFMNTPEAKEARIVLGYDAYRNILKKHLDMVDERRLDEINRAMADAMQEMQEAVKNAQSMTNEEILEKNSELVGKAKDLIYQEGDSVLDENKRRLALLDAAVKYNNDDILKELLNDEQ